MALSDYISGTYSQLVAQLGWASPFTSIVEKALQLYGVSSEEEATDREKLEALCDYAVWRQALADISLDYSFSADGNTYQRQQAVENVRKNLRAAETRVLAYLPEYQIIVHESDDNSDWYEEIQ